jgi:hypothetical protein
VLSRQVLCHNHNPLIFCVWPKGCLLLYTIVRTDSFFICLWIARL